MKELTLNRNECKDRLSKINFSEENPCEDVQGTTYQLECWTCNDATDDGNCLITGQYETCQANVCICTFGTQKVDPCLFSSCTAV